MKRYALIAFAWSLVLPLAAAGQNAAPLADRLPSEALFYVGWAGQNDAFDASFTGELMAGPTFQAVMEMIEQAIAEKVPQDEAEAATHVLKLVDIAWRHRLALSVIRVALPSPPETAPATQPAAAEADTASDGGAPPPPPMMGPQVAAVLLLDLGEDRAAFAEHLDAILASDEVPPLTDVTIGDVPCRVLMTPVGPFTLGYLGNTFFLTVGQDTAEELFATTAEASLAANERFATHLAAVVGAHPQACVYADVEAIRETVQTFLPPPPPEDADGQGPPLPDEAYLLNQEGFGAIWKIGGIDKATVLAGATNVDGQMLHAKVRLFSPAPHEGVLTVYAGQPITEADLATVPADADLLTVMNVSGEAVYDEVIRHLTTFPTPPGAPKPIDEFNEALAEIEAELGFAIREDVLASLGDTWTLCSAPSLGGLLTGTYASVEVKDREKLASVLSKIEALIVDEEDEDMVEDEFEDDEFPMPPMHPGGGMAFEIRTHQTGMAEIRYVQATRMSGFVPFFLAPAWCVADNRLYVAAFPQVLETALEHRPEKLLIEDEGFQALSAKLGPGPCTLSYSNTPKVLRQVYNFVLIVWTVGSAAGRDEGLPLHQSLLPSLGVLETYLRPELQTVHNDPEGITWQWYGSVPVGGAWGLMNVSASAAAGAAVPNVHRARFQARRAASMANLNMIARGAAMYEAEHSMHMNGFEDLLREGFIGANGLKSPHSNQPAPQFVNGKLVGQVDYVYLKPTPGARLIMAYEDPKYGCGKGVAVALVSGTVVWMDKADFDRLLAETQAARGQSDTLEEGF